MKFLKRLMTTALLVACGTACADGGGVFYHDGAVTNLTSAYAYSAKAWFDKSKDVVIVVLSSAPIDAAAFDAAPDREAAFGHFLGNFNTRGDSVKLYIGKDKDGHASVDEVDASINKSGEAQRISGGMLSSSYKLDLKSNDGKRIEGSLRSTDESDKTKKGERFYDLHFALNVASGPAFGPGLPPDGGEPFAAYEAYVSALSHAQGMFLDPDSYQALINTVSDARVKVMNQFVKKAKAEKGVFEDKIKDELRTMQRNVPSSKEFVSGRMNGDVATLEINGKRTNAEDGSEIEGSQMPVTVTMKKEKGQWFFDSDQPHATTAPAKK